MNSEHVPNVGVPAARGGEVRSFWEEPFGYRLEVEGLFHPDADVVADHQRRKPVPVDQHHSLAQAVGGPLGGSRKRGRREEDSLTRLEGVEATEEVAHLT